MPEWVCGNRVQSELGWDRQPPRLRHYSAELTGVSHIAGLDRWPVAASSNVQQRRSTSEHVTARRDSST